MKYHLEDTGEDIEWSDLNQLFQLEQFTSMNDPHGAKPTTFYRSREVAERIGREHVATEPWRTHAELREFAPGAPVGYGVVRTWWIHREPLVGGQIVVEEEPQPGRCLHAQMDRAWCDRPDLRCDLCPESNAQEQEQGK